MFCDVRPNLRTPHVHQLDRRADHFAMTGETLAQAAQTVGIRWRCTDLDGRTRAASRKKAGPAPKSVRLKAPRLARIARWWVAGSGRNLSTGPVQNILRRSRVREVKPSSPSPTTCGSLP